MYTFRQIISENSSKYSIYCDMDGVLVNFEKGYYDLTGKLPGSAKSYQSDPQQFWEPVTKAGKDFWRNLEWMPGGKQLWSYIKIYKPILLSSPSRDESSKTGKNEWIKTNIPGTNAIFKKAEEKVQFACPNCILIDDRDDTIKSWNDAGGVAIHHINVIDTINYLQKLGL